jgi:hypothetical protein
LALLRKGPSGSLLSACGSGYFTIRLEGQDLLHLAVGKLRTQLGQQQLKIRGGLHPGLPSEGFIEEEVALPMGVTIESTFDLDRAKEGDQGAGLAVDHFPVGGMVLPQLVIELFQQLLGFLAGFPQVLLEDRRFPPFDAFTVLAEVQLLQ